MPNSSRESPSGCKCQTPSTRSTQASTGDAGTVTAIAAGPITGGTGKFANIHGVVKAAVKFNVTSGFNEGITDIDYSMGE
jgi:hypothetical protein